MSSLNTPPSDAASTAVDDDRLARIALQIAEKALAVKPDRDPSGFWSWVGDQNMIHIVLSLIAVALTTVLCTILVIADIRGSKFDEVEPMAKFTSGLLATIIAYLVGNYVGSKTNKKR